MNRNIINIFPFHHSTNFKKEVYPWFIVRV